MKHKIFLIVLLVILLISFIVIRSINNDTKTEIVILKNKIAEIKTKKEFNNKYQEVLQEVNLIKAEIKNQEEQIKILETDVRNLESNIKNIESEIQKNVN